MSTERPGAGDWAAHPEAGDGDEDEGSPTETGERPHTGGVESDLAVLNVVVATPEARGGAVRAGLSLGEHLRKYVDVDTAKMRGDHDEALAAELDLSAPVHPLPSRTGLCDLVSRVVNSGHNYANAVIWTRLDPPRPLRSYDVVHVHNAVPIAGMVAVALSCRRAGVPYCVTTHGASKIPDLPDEMGLSRPARYAFDAGFLRPYRWVLRGATHLFALSRADVDRIYDLAPGQSVSVVPNGVRPNPPAWVDGEPAPADARTVEREVGVGPDERLVLFVGKLMASKGVDDLLAAHERLDVPHALVLAGPDREGYADRIAGVDGAIHAGYLDRDTLRALYRRADVFAFPTRADVFPLVVLEAMAAATPVVATRVGGIPDQVPDGAGLLVPPRSPGAVADALRDLLASPDRGREMGRRGLAAVEREYAWSAVARCVARQYRRILGIEAD